MFKSILKITLCFFLVYQKIVSTTDIIIPDIDLSKYGQTVIVGDFHGVSLYAYNKRGRTFGTSDAYNNELFIQSANGIYNSLGIVNGVINVMYTIKNNNNSYVVIAGKFSSIGNIKANNIVLYDLDKSTFITLDNGIPNGIIKTIYYDEKNKHIYVGGNFYHCDSSNVIIWDLSKKSWMKLPFKGFDGIVNTINKGNNQNILFGGRFDNTILYTLGSLSPLSINKKQVLNLQTALILSEHSSSDRRYSNPRNIICASTDKNQSSWTIKDSEIGKFFAFFRYVFRPSKIILKNSDVLNYSTKIFRFISFPTYGIMNLSYIDPVTKKQAFCEALCPLRQTSSEYQEFHFVNEIPMIGFRIEIIDWYGKGGGLKEIEILLSDIHTHAVNTFNEPSCVNEQLRSNSYVTGGPWKVLRINNESYLSANLSGLALLKSSITFEPRIERAGFYHVLLYTPGCIADNTCAIRGKVTTLIYYQEKKRPQKVIVYQTQNYGKIDTIYKGYVSAISSGFRPRVVLTPTEGQNGYLNIVSLSVKFVPISFFNDINGFFEFNPLNYSLKSFKEQQMSDSIIDLSRSLLSQNAIISSIIHDSSQVIIAGRFYSVKNITFSNIFKISSEIIPLAYGGVNGEILTMLLYHNVLYIGGNFNKIAGSSSKAFNNVLSYITSDDSWVSLLWGVNGAVYNIFKYNASVNGKFKIYIGFSGNFTQVLSFENEKLYDANGFALWDPDAKKWIENTDLFIDGRILNSIIISNDISLISASIRTIHSLRTFCAFFLQSSKSIHSFFPLFFPKTIVPFFNSLSKRSMNNPFESKHSIYTATFYRSQSLIIGGQFVIKNDENKLIRNIAIISNSKVSGINVNLTLPSVILSTVIYKDILYVGGHLQGKINNEEINGIFMYNLKKKKFPQQLFKLNGDNIHINILSMRPRSHELVVVGKFDIKKPVLCNGFCIFETLLKKWKSPSTIFSGEVTSLCWLSENSILLSGNINLNGTLLNLAKYDFDTSTLSEHLSGKFFLPGPAYSILYDRKDKNSLYFSGKKKNGNVYFNKWNGKTLLKLDSELLPNSIINHLCIIPLKRKHRRNDIIPEDIVILVLGSLVFSSFGTVTGAFYDGDNWIPYLISSTLTGQPGTANSIFFEHEIYSLSRRHLAKGYVVLISLSISLFIIFMMTLYRIFVSNYQRKKGTSQMFCFPREKQMHETPSTGISNESNRGNS